MRIAPGISNISFEFVPTFKKLEDFLRFYQEAHQRNEGVIIDMELPESYGSSLVGYPDAEQNCWLTLKYAIEQMNRSYFLGKSLVQVSISIKEKAR